MQSPWSMLDIHIIFRNHLELSNQLPFLVLKPKQPREGTVIYLNKKLASIQEVPEMFDKGYHCKQFLPSNTILYLRLAENLTGICYYPLLSILYLWQIFIDRILARVGNNNKGFTCVLFPDSGYFLMASTFSAFVWTHMLDMTYPRYLTYLHVANCTFPGF